MKCAEVLCLVTFLFYEVSTKGLQVQFEWTQVNYSWPDDTKSISTEDDPKAYDTFICENNVPMAANKWKNKMFVGIPRRRPGVPSTLNFVWINGTQKHNPPLIPYPDWDTNRMNTKNDDKVHLVSVYRMVVDECDRLWVVDDGRIESFGPDGTIWKIQKPSIVIIDLNTDKIIKQYFLKDTDMRPLTSVVNLAVDVERSSCDNAFAYVTDILGFGLIVYSLKENDSWRMNHRYFYLESLSEDLHIAGMSFQWMDGIFSIGLSEKNRDGFRSAYFHALAGTHIFTVSTEVLRSKQLATRSYHGDDVKILFDKGPTAHSSSSDLHKPTGVLFFALINQNALGCWNIYKKRASTYVDVLFRDDEKFIYPSDLKVTQNEIIAVSNKFPIYTYKGLNYTETNFRIWVTNVNDAIRHSVCTRN